MSFLDLKVIEFNWKIKKKLSSIFYTCFSLILSILEKWTGQGWRWRWKNFHGKMLWKLNEVVPTYIESTGKSLGKILSVKFFTVDPYFGVTFLTGQENHPTFNTFRQLWPWWGVRVVEKIIQPHFGIGQGNVW